LSWATRERAGALRVRAEAAREGARRFPSGFIFVTAPATGYRLQLLRPAGRDRGDLAAKPCIFFLQFASWSVLYCTVHPMRLGISSARWIMDASALHALFFTSLGVHGVFAADE
jgi:hypothetical protein